MGSWGTSFRSLPKRKVRSLQVLGKNRLETGPHGSMKLDLPFQRHEDNPLAILM